jgi:phage baseplate assembly protein W
MSNSLYTTTVITSKATVTSASSPRKYRGFSTVSTGTQNFALYDFELIKQDLLNSFHVRQGERLMNPTYGCVIWDLLFEPLTDDIRELVLQNVNQILNSDPRIQASNVIVTTYDTGLQIEAVLTYVQYNLQEQLQIQFDQTNGLTAQTV